MTIKVRDITKWAKLPAGFAINCVGEGLRRVKLEVNCETATRFDVVQGEEMTFLAAVDGLKTIEFVVDGPCEVAADTEGEVWFFTQDGEVTAIDDPEATTFTKIAGRRSRNPELELMMFKAEQRMNARLESQRAEFEAYMAKVGKHDPETGEVIDDAAENGADDAAGGEGGEPGADGPADAVADEKPGETPAKSGSGASGAGGTGAAK